MGHLSAMDMAEHGGVNEMTVSWHLTSNHFPPHPVQMVPVALAAIDAFNEEDPERLIDLFEGVEYKGKTQVPAWELVDALHLQAFIEAGAEVEL